MQDVVQYGIGIKVDSGAYKNITNLENRLAKLHRIVNNATKMSYHQPVENRKKKVRTEEDSHLKEQEKLQAKIDKAAFKAELKLATMEAITKEKKKQFIDAIKQAKSEREIQEALANQNYEARKLTQQYRKALRVQEKQSFVQERMSSSMKQMIGDAVTAFAGVSLVKGVAEVGQDYQGVAHAMLAVSDSADESGKRLKFVKGLSDQLGISYVKTANQYAQMIAAGKGQITEKQTQDTLKGLLDVSTVMDLTADQTQGSLVALTQMMGKGKVQAQELREQLGTRIPQAMRWMAEAAQQAGEIDANVPQDKLIGALNKAMELGKVITKDVMPHFSKLMLEFSKPTLEKALKKSRIAVGRFNNAIKDTANLIFISDFEEGYTELFHTMTAGLKENQPLWRALGRILGGVFKAAGLVVSVFSKLLSVVGVVLDKITSILGNTGMDILGGAILLGTLAKVIGMFGKTTKAIWGATEAMAAFEVASAGAGVASEAASAAGTVAGVAGTATAAGVSVAEVGFFEALLLRFKGLFSGLKGIFTKTIPVMFKKIFSKLARDFKVMGRFLGSFITFVESIALLPEVLAALTLGGAVAGVGYGVSTLLDQTGKNKVKYLSSDMVNPIDIFNPQVKPSTQQPVIQNNIHVNMDGEKVGEQVFKTNAAKNGVLNHVTPLTQHN